MFLVLLSVQCRLLTAAAIAAFGSVDFNVRGSRESCDRIEGPGKEKPTPKFREMQMKIVAERVVLISLTT